MDLLLVVLVLVLRYWYSGTGVSADGHHGIGIGNWSLYKCIIFYFKVHIKTFMPYIGSISKYAIIAQMDTIIDYNLEKSRNSNLKFLDDNGKSLSSSKYWS